MNPDIDRLTRRDETDAVASLAAAFAEYPLSIALCPDAARRPRAVAAMCRYLFRLALRCDGAFGTADRAAVVLAWPPGHEWPSLWDAFRAGGLGFLWKIGRRGTRFITRLEKELDVARRSHLGDRTHWYVPLLGVRPDSQGKGLSRAVLRPVFDAADCARFPVYLETVPESNVAIYRRLGFDLVGSRTLTSGLANWELLREPQPLT